MGAEFQELTQDPLIEARQMVSHRDILTTRTLAISDDLCAHPATGPVLVPTCGDGPIGPTGHRPRFQQVYEAVAAPCTVGAHANPHWREAPSPARQLEEKPTPIAPRT